MPPEDRFARAMASLAQSQQTMAETQKALVETQQSFARTFLHLETVVTTLPRFFRLLSVGLGLALVGLGILIWLAVTQSHTLAVHTQALQELVQRSTEH